MGSNFNPYSEFKRFTLPVKQTSLICRELTLYVHQKLIDLPLCLRISTSNGQGLLCVLRIVVEISACPLPTWEVCLRTKTLRILWLLRVHYSNTCSIQTYLILRNLRSWSKRKTSIVKTFNTKILKRISFKFRNFHFHVRDRIWN